MAAGNEILFCRIAVHNGLVGVREIDECLEVQRTRAPSRHIAQLMLDRGLIDEAQARAILAMQRYRLRRSDRQERPEDERDLAEALKQAASIPEEALEKARAEKAEMEERGLFPSIGDILVQQGAVSFRVLTEAADRLGRRPLWCASCGKKYRAVGYRPGIDARCRVCGGRLERREAGLAVPGAAPTESLQAPRGGPSDETPPLVSVAALDMALPDAFRARSLQRRAAVQPAVGDIIGGCRLEEKLGQGGFGQVFRARHLALDRDVALKTLLPQSAMDPSRVQRFLVEARAAARLSHPNIVAVHDVGEDRGVYYIVMQYINGKTIKRLLTERGRFGAREALGVARQAADALGYAHRKGIVHRDIKPHNMILEESGHVTIVDFGLTKRMEDDAGLTTDGIVVGTSQYMSPEQADGRAVDGRSDLYGLGVTLFEMLTLRVPIDGDSPWTILMRKQREPAPDVRTLTPDVPAPVAQLVAHLLERDPAARPPTGEAVVQEIDRCLAAL